MTGIVGVFTIVSYLDDVMNALRGRGIPVDAGVVSAASPAAHHLSITMGDGPIGLPGATLSWQPVVGWSLTSGQPRSPQWVLPLGVLADPGDIASTIEDLAAALTTPSAGC